MRYDKALGTVNSDNNPVMRIISAFFNKALPLHYHITGKQGSFHLPDKPTAVKEHPCAFLLNCKLLK